MKAKTRGAHANRGQVVDVEEAPIVDLLGGDTPVGEPIDLGADQLVQTLNDCGVARCAVEFDHDGRDGFARLRTLLSQVLEAALDDLALAMAYRNTRRIGLGARWQVADGGHDALKLEHILIFRARTSLRRSSTCWRISR